MSNLNEIATAVMESSKPAVADWHKVAASDARTAAHPDTEARHRAAYRSTEAKNLLSAVFAYDPENQLDLSTADRLLVAAMIAARAKGEAFALPYEPAEDEGPGGIVCDALAVLSCVNRAECFDGAESGYFVLHDGREFRFSVDVPAEWSGSQCPNAPDACWIDDETGEHVNATTGSRTGLCVSGKGEV